MHINNTTREKPTLFIIECSFNIFTFTIKFSIYIKQKAEGAELYTSGDKIRNIQNSIYVYVYEKSRNTSKKLKKKNHTDNKLMKTTNIFIYKHQKHNFLAFAA